MTKRPILAVLVPMLIASAALVPSASASAASASYANPLATADPTDFDVSGADVSYDLTGVTIVLHTQNVPVTTNPPSLDVQVSLIDRRVVTVDADGTGTVNDFNVSLIMHPSTSTTPPTPVDHADRYDSSKMLTNVSAPDVTMARDGAANTVTVSIPRKYIFWSGDVYFAGFFYLGNVKRQFYVAGDGTTSITTVGPIATYPLPTSTTASFSRSHQTYGKTPATVTASTSPAQPGTFTVRDGAAAVATSVTSTGSATFSLPRKFSSGKHQLTVSFTPTDGADWGVSTSGTTAFTVISVAKSTKTTVSASTRTTRYKHTASRLTIGVSHKPAGRIAVYDGKKKIATLTLRKGAAHYTLSKKLKPGLHRIKVKYVPSNREAYATSAKTISVRVKR